MSSEPEKCRHGAYRSNGCEICCTLPRPSPMRRDDATFRPVLPFDSDDPEFTRGFEAGQIWERLGHAEPFGCYLHPENAEMVMRMAEAKGATYTAEPCGDHWLWLKVTPSREAEAA